MKSSSKKKPKATKSSAKKATANTTKGIKTPQSKRAKRPSSSKPTPKARTLSFFSKNTKLKIIGVLVFIILFGYLIYSSTSLSDKVIYDASKDPASKGIKFGKGILPDPKEEDKQACNFIDLEKLNEQASLKFNLSTSRILSNQSEDTQTILCEFKADEGGITVLKRSFKLDLEAESTYKNSEGPQFKDLENENGELSYSEPQKQIIFQQGQSFYVINIVSTDKNFKEIEAAALIIPKQL